MKQLVESFCLKSIKNDNETHLEVPAATINVFIGPNNSGKSSALREIANCCRTGSVGSQSVVVKSIEFRRLTPAEANSEIHRLTLPPKRDEVIPSDQVRIGRFDASTTQHRANILQAMIAEGVSDNPRFASYYLQFVSVLLSSQNRMACKNEMKAGDLLERPGNVLQKLFQDDTARQSLSELIYAATGYYVTVDPTNPGKLRLRLSKRRVARNVEQSYSSEAREFHRTATLLADASDGVTALVGMLSELIAGDDHIILIDEPEAFLHPSLSFMLGSELSRLAREKGKQLFVATHSGAFLRGCLQKDRSMSVCRLFYDGTNSTVTHAGRETLNTLVQDPLLRSSKVFDGLFYTGVVVTESDSDRAFYEEVENRIGVFECKGRRPDILFLNAQNKQTTSRITGPLRKLGIRAVSVVDFDVFKEGGKPWSAIMEACNVPPISRDSLDAARRSLNNARKQEDWTTHRPLESLEERTRLDVLTVLKQLEEFGIFVVPVGELEDWFEEAGISARKSEWLLEIFEWMGDDPASNDYQLPDRASDYDNVWYFIRRIQDWIMPGLTRSEHS